MSHRFKCSMCTATTLVRLIWGGKPVCPACYLFERNRLDKLSFGDAIAICEERCICVYCGERATDREHVVPRSSGLPTWTVPACSECNSIASANVYDGIIAKKRAIQARLRKRYARALRTAEWDDDEIRELGPGLRPAVLAHRRAKVVVQQRVEWTLPGEITEAA